MKTIVCIGKGILSLIYALYKCFPQQKKIALVSRQSDEPGIDFIMLAKQIEKDMPGYRCVMLCRKTDHRIKYIFHMVFPQLFHIATSRAVILDTYCMAVSLLSHRKNLKVIQIWHALGAYKKFGKSILDKEEGTSSDLANLMSMHLGYDVILASSENARRPFAEAFGYPGDQIRISPLPRIDLLMSEKWKQETREKILAAVPQLCNSDKKVILYAPTFRKGDEIRQIQKIKELISAFDYSLYHVVVSCHPLMQEKLQDERVILPGQFSSMEWLCVSDIFVTDYSALLYEAAFAESEVYLYTYDIDNYIAERGFYIDPFKDLPTNPAQTIHDLVQMINNKTCDPAAVRQFAKDNITVPQIEAGGDLICTKSIVKILKQLIADQ